MQTVTESPDRVITRIAFQPGLHFVLNGKPSYRQPIVIADYDVDIC